MKENQEFRKESDLIGNKLIPKNALYGINTQRATENFKISEKKMSEYPHLIKGFAIIKKAKAQANTILSLI